MSRCAQTGSLIVGAPWVIRSADGTPSTFCELHGAVADLVALVYADHPDAVGDLVAAADRLMRGPCDPTSAPFPPVPPPPPPPPEPEPLPVAADDLAAGLERCAILAGLKP